MDHYKIIFDIQKGVAGTARVEKDSSMLCMVLRKLWLPQGNSVMVQPSKSGEKIRYAIENGTPFQVNFTMFNDVRNEEKERDLPLYRIK